MSDPPGPSKKKAKKAKRRRLPKDAKIAVVGSGMGGLSTAIALQKAGFTNVTVYERDSHFSERRDGYGLTLTYNPKGPLAKLGLLEKVAQNDCPSRSHYLFKPDGTILGYYGNEFHDIPSTASGDASSTHSNNSHRGNGQRGNLRVPRQVLRRIMMDEFLQETDTEADGKTSSCSIQWGKRLVSFEDRVTKMDDCNKFTCDNGGCGAVTIKFEDDSSEVVDLLVGSDGIRSTVTRTLLKEQQQDAGLSYLGVMIVLGITDIFYHPLLDERGFYTLDGTHRLFTMPFEGSKIDDILESEDPNNVKPRRRYMWQLSWREEDETKARELSTAGPQALREEITRRCKDWHEPVLSMVENTSLSNIWGTGLQDRQPEQITSLVSGFRSGGQSRVVILGDACHAMSCFKGQGANNALADGPLLASWLEKASVDSAIRGFMREMVARTGEKVKASRTAATFLHSPSVLETTEDFAGVTKERVANFLKLLEQKHVGASLGEKLDCTVRELLRQQKETYVRSCLAEKQNAQNDGAGIEDKALAYAASGTTEELRRMSPDIIHNAVDTKGRSCLHVAALGGHYYTCRFLLTESFVPHSISDDDGNTPLHSACSGQSVKTVELLSAVSRNTKECWAKNEYGSTPSMIVDKCKDETTRSALSNALS